MSDLPRDCFCGMREVCERCDESCAASAKEKVSTPLFLQKKIAFVVIREYAAHSYLYYDKDSPIIEDGEYDALCKWMLKNYAWIKPHDINNYVRKDMLECGSGYDIKVTGLTRNYAELLLADHIEKEEDAFA